MAWNRWIKSQGREIHVTVTPYHPDHICSLTLTASERSLKQTTLNTLEGTDRRKELLICIQSVPPLDRKCDVFTGG